MRSLVFILAIALLMTAPTAFAQQGPQDMMGQGGMGQGGMGQGGMGQGMMMSCDHMPMMGGMQSGRHIEGRIAFLKTELKITDAQIPQWNAYATALRANATRMQALRAEMMSKGMMSHGMMSHGQAGKGPSVPEHLAWAEQHMAAHMEMLGEIKGPLSDLYGVLNDEQKHLADELLMGSMGMM